MRLDHLGAFPSASRPRVIWAGAKLPEANALIELAQAVRSGVQALGILSEQDTDEERAFVPHVTIGRVRSQRKVRELCRLFSEQVKRWQPTEPHRVEKVTLFESRLSAKGPTYSALGACALGKSA
jgi:2'-5' RNA ligase